jgi:hypothetical protein
MNTKLFLLFILSFNNINVHKIRTDGFYFFDNGLDKVNIVPGGIQMNIEIINMLKEEGLYPKDKKLTYYDSMAVNSEGSTKIECLSFFDSISGTLFGTSIRNDSFAKNIKPIIDWRRSMVGNSKMKIFNKDSLTEWNFDSSTKIFNDLHYLNDSTFIFVTGAFDHNFKKIHTCKILKDGKLHMKTVHFLRPDIIMGDETLEFIPFNNIPKNLLIKYKDAK